MDFNFVRGLAFVVGELAVFAVFVRCIAGALSFLVDVVERL